MNINSIDLNLIPILHALLEEVHISKTAARVGLSQPAVSQALNRLRSLFDDPLLVRNGRQMSLTPVAISLQEPIAQLMANLEAVLLERKPFDPSTWESNIRIGCKDLSELVILSELAPRLESIAPHVQLNGLVADLSGPYHSLASGDMALALGYFPNAPEHIFRKDLIDERFVCIVREGHPQIKNQLSLEDYLEFSHVLIAPMGTPRGMVDVYLEERNMKRHIAVVVAHFMAAPEIVMKSNHISTLPERIAKKAAQGRPLCIFDPPLPIPGFQMQMIWHERTHHDPALSWLRSEIISMTHQWKNKDS